MPKVSVVIPWHFMDRWRYFLTRALTSVEMQDYPDYEVVMIKAGSMPVTTNRVMEAAKGDLIKILYMDDYLANRTSLTDIVGAIGDKPWLVTGCGHDDGEHKGASHIPKYSKDIHTGNNTIGSPSVLTMRRDKMLLFDERLSWLLDCDLYRRLYDTYGEPVILPEDNVIIGLHNAQTSNLMTMDQKKAEAELLKAKYHV